MTPTPRAFRPRYESAPTDSDKPNYVLYGGVLFIALLFIFMYWQLNTTEKEVRTLQFEISNLKNTTPSCVIETNYRTEALTKELTKMYNEYDACKKLLEESTEERMKTLKDSIELQNQCWGPSKNNTNYLLWQCQAQLELCRTELMILR